MFPFNKNIKQEFKELFALLENSDFRKEDKESARGLLLADEPGLSLDTIITQLYEYNIKIDMKTYDIIKHIAAQLNIKESEFGFLKELIE